MFEKLEIFQMAGAMMGQAQTRQTVIARNIANADTPGYKARDLASFSQTYRQETDGFATRATRASHLTGASQYQPVMIPGAGDESPNGNNVSLETEMLKSAEIRSEHDRALAIYKSSLGILRSSLGRR